MSFAIILALLNLAATVIILIDVAMLHRDRRRHQQKDPETMSTPLTDSALDRLKTAIDGFSTDTSSKAAAAAKDAADKAAAAAAAATDAEAAGKVDDLAKSLQPAPAEVEQPAPQAEAQAAEPAAEVVA
jgi:hypothetical protein